MPSFLSERGGVQADTWFVADTLARTRRDFVEMLASLPEADWSRPTRCSEWTVHQVARHVRDVARIHVKQLATGGQAIDATAFDPRETPSVWLKNSEAETPEETLGSLRSAFAEEGELLADQSTRPAGEFWRGPATGRLLHPSTFSLHVHWDAWLHLRDIAVPLSLPTAPNASVTQAAILYGLLLAATPACLGGMPLQTSALLDGSPSAGYTIAYGDDSGVVITATPGPEGPALRAEAIPLVESLMGRGPALDAVVTGPADVVQMLGMLRVIAV